MPIPQVSVVVPVYNEEAALPALFARLYLALDKLGVAYEAVFIKDGRGGRSVQVSWVPTERRPDA